MPSRTPASSGSGAVMIVRPSRSFGDRAGFIVELDRIDLAELAEHREIVPSAAADLEDARVGRRRDFAADELGEDLAARAIPPMPLVELGHFPIDEAFHQPNTHCRLNR